jgi:hypothetical protein
MSMSTTLTAYLDQENMHQIEGRRGVEHLCKLVETLGYKDPQYFGTLNNRASIGSLVLFFEDNPGAIESIQNWIGKQNAREWVDRLDAELHDPLDPEEGG